MKKIYHLLTRMIEKFSSSHHHITTSPHHHIISSSHHHIISSSHHLIISSFLFFLFLPFFALAQPPVPMLEAEVTDVVFSCPGIVEITYDLDVCRSVNVSVSYSPDKCTWNSVPGAEGAVGLQSAGTDKKITWDAAAHNANFGKLYFKVEYPADPNPNPTPVLIDGVKWAPVNLDVGGVFCENPWDYGGLYQWGRVADGHECRTSATTTTLSSTDVPGHGDFILTSDIPNDWRSPQNNALWNSGTETVPVKTANDPCPDGWRVPTHNEFSKLALTTNVTTVLTTQNGINGCLCTDNAPPYNSLFIPAADTRKCSDGLLLLGLGVYWCSSTPAALLPQHAYAVDVTGLLRTFEYRAHGLSVRCVSEN